MNEISRCCRLLGVKGGMSLDDVKKVYRDLVQVWHPDRFSGNERLAAKAQEQLKEINLAYDFLLANAFQDDILVEPTDDSVTSVATMDESTSPAASASEPDSTDSKTDATAPAGSRNMLWAVCGVVMILAVCGIFWFLHAHNANPKADSALNASTPLTSASNQPNISAETTPKPATRPVTQSASVFPFSKDVLAELSSSNGPDCLEAPYLLSPPFAVRTKVMFTNVPDIRLCYGISRVIFNWGDHPDQLRIHDPRTWNVTAVDHQGLLLPNSTHELVWTFMTNHMSVSVDGQIRFQTDGNYDKLKGYPSFDPPSGRDMLQSFILETPAELENTPIPARGHGPIAGDILASMVPEKSRQMSIQPDGTVIWTVGNSGNRLMSPQTFRPPFLIRARAKTDALNLRLYCGNGEVIFNWERNLGELRVHDPMNGAQVGIRNQGLISPNEWHAVVWEIQKNGMRVSVDGKIRFQKQANYDKLNAPVGIGPGLSRITVDYFQVEKSDALSSATR